MKPFKVIKIYFECKYMLRLHLTLCSESVPKSLFCSVIFKLTLAVESHGSINTSVVLG